MSSAALPGAPPPEPLLQVRGLTIDLEPVRGAAGTAGRVVAGASFEVRSGSITGLLGESGCGKTTLALALLGLLPADRYRLEGSVRLDGCELLAMTGREWERVRGARAAMVFQDPLLALNPVLRVREQAYEAIRAHSPLRRGETAGRIEPLLQLVGLPASRRLYDAYPHQLSGGERQRVAIALALACRPALVVADEPFTALDLPRVLELSALFRGLTEKLGVSFLLIDHSPGVASRIADQALVMYAGQIVERGTPREVIGSPKHPYTAALLKSMPAPAALRGGPRLAAGRRFSIPGNPPGLAARPPGCPFEPRCGDRMPRCAAEAPGERRVEGRRFARCFKYGD